MKTKVLVTGGCGFIGSHLVDALIEEGYRVNVLDNLSTGKIENLNPKAEFFNGTITKLSHLGMAIEGCEFVYHAAALARIQPSIDRPRTSHAVNFNGTFNVLEACRKNKCKLIFSSSSSIYEGSDLPTHEEDDIQPKNPYALHKWLSEQCIELYADLYGLEYAILRYFNVFGERQIMNGAYAAVVGIFLDQKRKSKKLTITNDGEQSRDFTYVKDVARANLMAMGWQGTFNIGTENNYTINEIADFVGGEKEYIGDRVGEVRETLADTSRANKLGWRYTKDIGGWINEQIRR